MKEYCSNDLQGSTTNYQDKLLLTQNNREGKISMSAQSSDLRESLPQRGSTDSSPCGDIVPLTDTNMTRKGCLCYSLDHFLFSCLSRAGAMKGLPEGLTHQPLPPLIGANAAVQPQRHHPRGSGGARRAPSEPGPLRGPLASATAQRLPRHCLPTASRLPATPLTQRPRPHRETPRKIALQARGRDHSGDRGRIQAPKGTSFWG